MKKIILMTSLLSLLSGKVFAENLRDKLLDVAKREDSRFPDEQNSLLTHFSISCSLGEGKHLIYVVDQRAVLSGMLSPRGQNKISFYSKGLKFLGGLKYVFSRPLWCDQSKLYLFGAWDGAMPGDTKCKSDQGCNVIRWNSGAQKIELIHEKKYGSSGGL